MKRLTYDFELGGEHCWQVEGADNLVCRDVCERQENDNGCKTCPIARAFDRLAAIEDILGDEYELTDVAPVRHGRWEPGNPICPVCGENKFKDLDADVWADWQPKFCPNCGARMGKEDEHEAD